MPKISITKRWELDESDSNYPKNHTKYKTVKCRNKWSCQYQVDGICSYWHNESERDWWKYIRTTAERRGLQPAEIDKEIRRQNLLAQGKLVVGSQLPKKQKEVRGTSPFEYGLGGRKKRKTKRKRRKKINTRRKKSSSKKRKSRKRRRTKRKKK